MKNCLLTQFKGNANNDNLDIFDTFVVKATQLSTIEDASAQQGLRFYGLFSLTIKVDGEGYFGTSVQDMDAQHYTEHTIDFSPGNNVALYFSNGTYNIYISSKYKLDELFSLNNTSTTYRSLFGFNIEKVSKYIPLSNLNLNNGNCYGSIDAWSNIPGNLQKIAIALPNNQNVSGNIKSIGQFTSLIGFRFDGTGVTGDVVDFVEKQVENGRLTPSSPLSTRAILTYLTFADNSYSENFASYLDWDYSNGRSKIVVYCRGNVTTSTNIYAKGATQAEISAWESAGKTVTHFDDAD